MKRRLIAAHQPGLAVEMDFIDMAIDSHLKQNGLTRDDVEIEINRKARNAPIGQVIVVLEPEIGNPNWQGDSA